MRERGEKKWEKALLNFFFFPPKEKNLFQKFFKKFKNLKIFTPKQFY